MEEVRTNFLHLTTLNYDPKTGNIYNKLPAVRVRIIVNLSRTMRHKFAVCNTAKAYHNFSV